MNGRSSTAVTTTVPPCPGRAVSFILMPTAKSQDTGPLTIKRMETVDEEITAAAIDFMDRPA